MKAAVQIVKKLQDSGFEAYFAGGSVRDMLFKKEPVDFDIATSAKPQEVEKIFKKTKPVGKDFGVVLVIENNIAFEVATFRADIGTDTRRPKKVKFVSAKEDAFRRDFTINGIFYDPVKKKYIDFVDGEKDLRRKIIRFIGVPKKRIDEDYLRVLRAVRFKNVLGFDYDGKTMEAVKENVEKVSKVSSERVREELDKMFVNKNRSYAVEDMSKFGLLEIVLPEIEEMRKVEQSPPYHHEGDVFAHILLVLKEIPENSDVDLVWACMLHDLGKKETRKELPMNRVSFHGHASFSVEKSEKILRRLKFSKQRIKKILWLVEFHQKFCDIPKMRVGRRRNLFMHEYFPLLIQLFHADLFGSIPKAKKDYKAVADLYRTDKKVLKKLKVEKPLVMGDDIMKEFGLAPGKKVGELLKVAKDAQIERKVKTKKEMLEFLKKSIALF
ncbi:MAG: hypothetical protein ACD_63C00034G0002 [uncultured bacterium]|nr:MAG: hypothetical protein ACD_63C00034G0002 [uncultured bacterium]